MQASEVASVEKAIEMIAPTGLAFAACPKSNPQETPLPASEDRSRPQQRSHVKVSPLQVSVMDMHHDLQANIKDGIRPASQRVQDGPQSTSNNYYVEEPMSPPQPHAFPSHPSGREATNQKHCHHVVGASSSACHHAHAHPAGAPQGHIMHHVTRTLERNCKPDGGAKDEELRMKEIRRIYKGHGRVHTHCTYKYVHENICEGFAAL
jgi:hypothetical protein